jgi:WD40 repeat protein
MRGSLSATVLGLAAVILLWPPAAAQQPPKLPAINPATARLDVTLDGLGGPGFAVAADGRSRILAAACENGTVHYWLRDVLMGVRQGGHTSQVLEGHRGPVTALAWLSDDRLASGGADRNIFVWRMPEGELLHKLSASATVRALAASPAGKQLASAEDSSVQLWDADAGKRVQKLEGPTDWQLCLAFSPDGAQLAGGGYDARLRVWEVSSGKKLLDVPAQPATPKGGTEEPASVIHAVVFSPDGKEVAAGCADARIHLFSMADGKLLRSVAGHTSAVTALSYHPGGAVLVSGSKDGSVRLWNPANGQLLKALEGHGAWVQGVAVLEQGTRLASVGADRTVRLWDLTPSK